MTEDEYITVADLIRVRIAKEVLAGTMLSGPPFKEFLRYLSQTEDELYKKVEDAQE